MPKPASTALEVYAALKKHPGLYEDVRQLFLGDVPVYGWVVQHFVVTRAQARQWDNSPQLQPRVWFLYREYTFAAEQMTEASAEYMRPQPIDVAQRGEHFVCSGPVPVFLSGSFKTDSSRERTWWTGVAAEGPKPLAFVQHGDVRHAVPAESG